MVIGLQSRLATMESNPNAQANTGSNPLSQWLGGRYIIVLKDPAGERIEGTLRGLVPEQYMTLGRAVLLRTNQTVEQLNIDATNVADIIAVQAPAVQPPFQDPAILSLGARTNMALPDDPHHAQANIREKRDPPVIPNPADRMTYTSPDELTDAPNPDAPEGSMSQLSLSPSNTAKLDSTPRGDFLLTPTASNASNAPSGSKKDRRRGARGRGGRKNKKLASDSVEDATQDETNPATGWRQTPILQSTESFQPFTSLKKSQKGRLGLKPESGWASEDVTDVQEAGDFDFESSLAKFDKRKIFDEMKEQDEIDESQRLVSHNRIPRPKPGTAGGKNLHYTENVLDLPSSTAKPKEPSGDFWKSEADDENGDAAERLSGSGRNSRLRGESRLSMSRRSQSRKASTSAGAGGQGRIHGAPASSSKSSGGLYALLSNRRVETVTHLQMLVVENVAHNDFGFTEDLMAENAGRSISEVAMRALDDPAVRLRAAASSPPSTSMIVILAGNNKSGARALAAARHLRNHGVNVIVCVVGIEREQSLLEDVRKQIRLLRSFGGTILDKSELFEHVSQAATLKSSPYVALIIDALLGLTISFEELRKSDQATTYELMEWSNRNEAFVIAIDVPSGIEPSSGKVNVIDGAKLYVHPRFVVALGAPKQGLLKALQMGEEQGDTLMSEEWKLFLADVGLSPLVWRKAATKIRRGIEFEDRWVLELQYRSQVERGP
ncbi:YjeF-related protein N-terminus-domain-containing protein [Durotheca rogersii]|uniref:YjeF-related protein N-terminus-domain-containing protein n=1 Tax=Durotheca rogersii TaxID=419775 RepID=UPI00221E8606|nr:YjeF-related protein N-terminus-domain-containing protein [Durotheca rogersii]KAI5860611.1 YjeF-related protein N-terminus-domain-containing protein [Durotheca rogersii]